jgi:hypothetical protein
VIFQTCKAEEKHVSAALAASQDKLTAATDAAKRRHSPRQSISLSLS